MLNLLISKAYAAAFAPPTQDLAYWIKNIFGWVIAVAGIAFVVLFLVGGIQYLTSAGNEEQSTKAKKLLVDAVVGLLIVMVAWAAGRWVLNSLGVPTDNVIPV